MRDEGNVDVFGLNISECSLLYSRSYSFCLHRLRLTSWNRDDLDIEHRRSSILRNVQFIDSRNDVPFRRMTISLEMIRDSSANESAALLTIGDSDQSACSRAREASVTRHWQFIAMPLFFRSLFLSPRSISPLCSLCTSWRATPPALQKELRERCDRSNAGLL